MPYWVPPISAMSPYGRAASIAVLSESAVRLGRKRDRAAGKPVTAARKCSRSSVRSEHVSSVLTVAVRGTSRSNAISPKKSPGPSVTSAAPAFDTTTLPASTT